MSQNRYERSVMKVKHQAEKDLLDAKSVKHYDQYDIEREVEKRWIFCALYFIAGLFISYLLFKLC